MEFALGLRLANQLPLPKASAIRQGATGIFLTPFSIDLRPDEVGSVEAFRLKYVVSTTKHSKLPLIVTTIDCEGPFVVDLESRSGAAPRPVTRLKLALMARSLENALAYLGRNVAGLRCFLFLLACFLRGNLARARFDSGLVLLPFPLDPSFKFPLCLISALELGLSPRNLCNMSNDKSDVSFLFTNQSLNAHDLKLNGVTSSPPSGILSRFDRASTEGTK